MRLNFMNLDISDIRILELATISKIPVKRSLIQVIQRKIKFLFAKDRKNTKYVTWDGNSEVIYEYPGQQDILYVEGLRSILKIQHLRKNLILSGYLVTVIFSCKPQTYSYTARFEFDNQWHDVFGHCFALVRQHYPEATYRDIIRLTNLAISKTGVMQQAEIICRQDILDKKFNQKIRSENHIILVFDICRR
jgi:hypothetical protein